MVELTFKDHSIDKLEAFQIAHAMLKKTIQRLRRKYGSFKYARVFEVHQSGFPHVHMIVNSFIPIEFIKQAWQDCGGGHVSIHEQKCKICGGKLPCIVHGQRKQVSYKQAARYLTEELEKKRQDPHRLGVDYFLSGVKTIMTSRNLKLKKSPFTDWMFYAANQSFEAAMLQYEQLMYEHKYNGGMRPSIEFGKNRVLIGTGYSDSPDVDFSWENN
jgi:hypothetical protein